MDREPFRHYQGLKNARTIETASFLATEQAIDRIRLTTALMAVIGGPGTGKTFAIRQILRTRSDIDHVWVQFPMESTPRLVSQKLVEALTGERLPKIEQNEILRQRAIELLQKRKPLVVIDEAQNLNKACIEGLRYLHDVSGCSFPMILAGGDGCWDVLRAERMLKSRILDFVRHRALSEEEVEEIIPTYHPIYETMNLQLIKNIDARRCQGEFRIWAAFTLKLTQLLDKEQRTDPTTDDVEIILETMPEL